MFGNYQRNIDNKGRLLLPAELRNSLGKRVFVSFGNNTLDVFTVEAFESLKKRLLSASALNKNLRDYKRIFFGNTFEIEVDKSGRINIQDASLKFAGIKKEVVILGLGDKIELWAKERYDEFAKKYEGNESIEALQDKLFDEGIEI
ncbi:MAG: division/cell wall cluster transcriptional repressor MraZ [Mycoplasma sp.]|nr:division/cell wall cluster transcriptional repressor MraZ [Mycoplasma sp.]